MKKILFVLGIAIVCLCSCNQNPDVDDPNTDNPTTETPDTDEEKSDCIVTLVKSSTDNAYESEDFLVLNNVIIKDKNGEVVATGAEWTTYTVPYTGTITLNWNHRQYTKASNNAWTTSEYTIKCTTREMEVDIYNSNYGFSSIYVNGDMIISFEHEY